MPIRPLRALLTLLLAAALAVGAVACGSDDDGGSGGTKAETSEQKPLSEAAYKREINSAQTDFGSDAAGLNLANPSSPKGFKKSLDELGVLIDKLTGRLERVEPPESVASQHDELVTQLTAYGDVIDEQKGGLGSGDQEKVVDSATRIGKASTTFSEDFRATIDRINTRLE